MIQEIIKDTIQNSEKDIGFVKNAGNFLSEQEIIIVPLLLLAIIYALKYFFGNSFSKKSILEFLFEFPVDFGFIGITFVFTYFFLDVKIAIFGRIMILMCIIIALVNSTIRRLAIIEYNKERYSTIKLGIYGISNLSISIFFVYFILNSIQNS